ncbi:unnamed protein product, partial [Mesorhabditis spiculigera]
METLADTSLESPKPEEPNDPSQDGEILVQVEGPTVEGEETAAMADPGQQDDEAAEVPKVVSEPSTSQPVPTDESTSSGEPVETTAPKEPKKPPEDISSAVKTVLYSIDELPLDSNAKYGLDLVDKEGKPWLIQVRFEEMKKVLRIKKMRIYPERPGFENLNPGCVAIAPDVGELQQRQIIREALQEYVAYLTKYAEEEVEDKHLLVNQSTVKVLEREHVATLDRSYHHSQFKDALFLCGICKFHLFHPSSALEHCIGPEHRGNMEKIEIHERLYKLPQLESQHYSAIDAEIRRLSAPSSLLAEFTANADRAHKFIEECLRELTADSAFTWNLTHYGSSATGLAAVGGKVTSDVNLHLMVHDVKESIIWELMNKLHRHLEAISKANTASITVTYMKKPNVMTLHYESVQVVLRANDYRRTIFSNAISQWAAVRSNLVPFLRWIRRWAMISDLVERTQDMHPGLPTYVVDMFAIHFLLRAGLIPPVFNKDTQAVEINEPTTYELLSDVEIKELAGTDTSDGWCLGKLFHDFLEYYSKKHSQALRIQVVSADIPMLRIGTSRRFFISDPAGLSTSLSQTVATHLYNVVLHSYCYLRVPDFMDSEKSPLRLVMDPREREGRKDGKNHDHGKATPQKVPAVPAAITDSDIDPSTNWVYNAKDLDEEGLLVEFADQQQLQYTPMALLQILSNDPNQHCYAGQLPELEKLYSADEERYYSIFQIFDSPTNITQRIETVLRLHYASRRYRMLAPNDPNLCAPAIEMEEMDGGNKHCPVDRLYAWKPEPVVQEPSVNINGGLPFQSHNVTRDSEAEAGGWSDTEAEVKIDYGKSNASTSEAPDPTVTVFPVVAGNADLVGGLKLLSLASNEKMSTDELRVQFANEKLNFDELAARSCDYDFGAALNFTGGYIIDRRCAACNDPTHTKDYCPFLEVPKYSKLKLPGDPVIRQLDCVIGRLYNLEAVTEEQSEEVQTRVNQLQQRINTSNFGKQMGPITLKVFGSYCNTIGGRASDVDICLTFDESPEEPPRKHSTKSVMQRLESALRYCQFTDNIVLVARAKVPIVQFSLFFDSKKGKFSKYNNLLQHQDYRRLDADISYYNLLAMHNSRLISTYCDIWPPLRSLGIFVKLWAKNNQIGDAACGSISSYGHMLLLIHFLQQADILPVLSEAPWTDGLEKQFCEGFDVTFASDVESIKVVQIRRKAMLTIEEKRNEDLKVQKMIQWSTERGIYIEDPFDRTHNLPSGIKDRMLAYVRRCFDASRVKLYSSEDLGITLKDGKKRKLKLSPDVLEKQIVDLMRALQFAEVVPEANARCVHCKKVGHFVRNCPVKQTHHPFTKKTPVKNLDRTPVKSGAQHGPAKPRLGPGFPNMTATTRPAQATQPAGPSRSNKYSAPAPAKQQSKGGTHTTVPLAPSPLLDHQPSTPSSDLPAVPQQFEDVEEESLDSEVDAEMVEDIRAFSEPDGLIVSPSSATVSPLTVKRQGLNIVTHRRRDPLDGDGEVTSDPESPDEDMALEMLAQNSHMRQGIIQIMKRDSHVQVDDVLPLPNAVQEDLNSVPSAVEADQEESKNADEDRTLDETNDTETGSTVTVVLPHPLPPIAPRPRFRPPRERGIFRVPPPLTLPTPEIRDGHRDGELTDPSQASVTVEDVTVDESEPAFTALPEAMIESLKRLTPEQTQQLLHILSPNSSSFENFAGPVSDESNKPVGQDYHRATATERQAAGRDWWLAQQPGTVHGSTDESLAAQLIREDIERSGQDVAHHHQHLLGHLSLDEFEEQQARWLEAELGLPVASYANVDNTWDRPSTSREPDEGFPIPGTFRDLGGTTVDEWARLQDEHYPQEPRTEPQPKPKSKRSKLRPAEASMFANAKIEEPLPGPSQPVEDVVLGTFHQIGGTTVEEWAKLQDETSWAGRPMMLCNDFEGYEEAVENGYLGGPMEAPRESQFVWNSPNASPHNSNLEPEWLADPLVDHRPDRLYFDRRFHVEDITKAKVGERGVLPMPREIVNSNFQAKGFADNCQWEKIDVSAKSKDTPPPKDKKRKTKAPGNSRNQPTAANP